MEQENVQAPGSGLGGRDEGNEEGRPHDLERWGKLGGPTKKTGE